MTKVRGPEKDIWRATGDLGIHVNICNYIGGPQDPLKPTERTRAKIFAA